LGKAVRPARMASFTSNAATSANRLNFGRIGALVLTWIMPSVFNSVAVSST
jgi:hypothetical protein